MENLKSADLSCMTRTIVNSLATCEKLVDVDLIC